MLDHKQVILQTYELKGYKTFYKQGKNTAYIYKDLSEVYKLNFKTLITKKISVLKRLDKKKYEQSFIRIYGKELHLKNNINSIEEVLND